MPHGCGCVEIVYFKITDQFLLSGDCMLHRGEHIIMGGYVCVCRLCKLS